MIDVWFDCRQDANNKDPDQHSLTLKRYHAELWAKPLPNGRQLTMLDQGSYLIASDGRCHLTLECIARWYRGEENPLADVFDRYGDFFEWFGDFQGYVDFFLLQDFVDDEYQVKILTDFDDFQSSPLPKTVERYTAYLQGLTEVLTLRAERIERYVN